MIRRDDQTAAGRNVLDALMFQSPEYSAPQTDDWSHQADRPFRQRRLNAPGIGTGLLA